MIFQPWSNAELQNISAATPLSTRQNVRGQAGGRVWNITPWWWDVLAEGDPNREQAIVPPWSFLEFELQQDDLLELVLTTATDLNSLPLTSSPVWRFMFEFIGDPHDVHPQVLALSQQLASTDTVKVLGSPLPAGAVPVTNSSGNVAATATSATLPASATLFTWITGFQVTGAGATAASVILVTVTGVQGGTMTYALVVPAGATTSITPLAVPFQPAVRSSAINTAIAVSVPSFGAGNTNAAVTAQGYQA